MMLSQTNKFNHVLSYVNCCCGAASNYYKLNEKRRFYVSVKCK